MTENLCYLYNFMYEEFYIKEICVFVAPIALLYGSSAYRQNLNLGVFEHCCFDVINLFSVGSFKT